MDARSYLKNVGSEVQSAFEKNRMILSFEEWFQLFLQDPAGQARSAAQVLRDAMDHFGAREVDTPVGQTRRFLLFDAPFDGGVGRVAGQEDAQNAIYRILGNFIRAGRVNKVILLHGPNGSAKSSLVRALFRALEVYTRKPEGALYKLNWIFPSEKLVKGSIGFGERGSGGELLTFAHLDAEQIEARIPCELKDHPLFLVPQHERKALLTRELSRVGKPDMILSDWILEGELCHKCRQIYAGLLATNNGDYLKVLRNVQIERWYVSTRYLRGASTVEPQLSVDASYAQVAADRSVGHLPPALVNTDMFVPHGALVNANRGMIEYSDLLKRQPETYKYLLGTTETGVVPLEHFLLHLDEVLIATSNEKHLAAFKEVPDFASFKGRIELVRVPYLRRASVEREIYDAQVTPNTVGKHIAPHATEVAALWAVLTRLRRPEAERYEAPLREVVDDLSPLEKARLYDEGRGPDRLALSQVRELRKAAEALYREWDVYPMYEGRSGASAREVKTVLFNAAQNPRAACLTPLAVIEELDQLVKDKSVYEFLMQEPRDGFHDHEEFVRVVEAEYLDQIDDEIRDSMGLVTERQYEELFERYILQVSHWVKGEKIANRVTGEYERPDEDRMAEVEKIVRAEGADRGDFRRGLIAAVGAWRLDHPSEKVEYGRIFPDLFRRLRDHFFEERKRTLRRNKENVLKYLAEDERGSLSPKEKASVEEMLANMTSRYGYCEHCARDAILFLMRERYSG